MKAIRGLDVVSDEQKTRNTVFLDSLNESIQVTGLLGTVRKVALLNNTFMDSFSVVAERIRFRIKFKRAVQKLQQEIA